ncbi:MAG: hypothetical protein ABSA76_07850 [Bacteroidales bacterium]
MKNIFIELTDKNDSKILLNVFRITYIEPHDSGSLIVSDIVNRTISKKVKESYADIKSLIGSLSSQ